MALFRFRSTLFSGDLDVRSPHFVVFATLAMT